MSKQLEILQEYVELHLDASQSANIKMSDLGNKAGENYTSGESSAFLAVLGMINAMLEEKNDE